MLILKPLPVAKNRDVPCEIITKKKSLKIVIYYAFGRFRSVASVVLQAGLYLFGGAAVAQWLTFRHRASSI
jgi:hypothetical protein